MCCFAPFGSETQVAPLLFVVLYVSQVTHPFDSDPLVNVVWQLPESIQESTLEFPQAHGVLRVAVQRKYTTRSPQAHVGIL